MPPKPAPVSTAGLEEANRQLAFLEDVAIAESGESPAWVVAARHAVRRELRRRDGD